MLDVGKTTDVLDPQAQTTKDGFKSTIRNTAVLRVHPYNPEIKWDPQIWSHQDTDIEESNR